MWRQRVAWRVLLALSIAALGEAGCGEGEGNVDSGPEGGVDGGGDADRDADGDAESDADEGLDADREADVESDADGADAEADADADADGDVEPPPRSTLLALGSDHTCAVAVTGAVRCWGSGDYGQHGHGTSVTIGDDETPASAGDVDVGGLAVQVTAGERHGCALLETGAVRCWGEGDGGVLGYGNTQNVGDDETPASAGDVDVGGVVVQVEAGGRHTCALLETDAVRCWGVGVDGRLGYGDEAYVGDDEDPATAGDVEVGGPVRQLAAGGAHTCALLETGAVRCWGRGRDGALGYGDTEDIGDDETPASAGDVPLGGAARAIAAWGDHTCAILEAGGLRCWGEGSNGRLGLGDTETIGDDETPASSPVVDVGGTVVAVTTGYAHTCALLDTGAVRCWGLGIRGQLGHGDTATIGDDETPASAGDVDVGGRAVHVAAGGSHTCATLETGGVRCWGSSGNGELGYGTSEQIGDDETPASAGDVLIW